MEAGDAAPATRILCPGCGAFSAVPAVDAPRAEVQPPVTPAAPPGEEAGSPFAPGGEPVAGEDAENPYRAPNEYSPPPVYVPTGRTDPKAVASLVLGLCGFMLFCFCVPLELPVAITGLVLGIMGRNSENRGLAIAGIILCAVQLALVAAGAAAMLAFIMAAGAPQAPLGGW